MAANNPERPQDLPFAIVSDQLDPLLIALSNLLDREFPRDLASIPGLQPFLLVGLNITKTTYEAIRYLAADTPEDPRRKLEFGLAAVPIVRSLLDLLFSIVFMREDLASHVVWYHRGGWRELKEEFDRYRSFYEGMPEWHDWLVRFEGALEGTRQMWKIPDTDAADPKKLPYWPIPSRIVDPKRPLYKKLSEQGKQFLPFLYDWFYRELSATAHISAGGIFHYYGFLLLTREEGREQALLKLKSDVVFTTVTLVLAICTEVNHLCRYGRDTPLSFLWRVLVDYWEEAKDLFERRYEMLLATHISECST
jgi:hypothetical protein